jgi:hypothetical protein
MLCASGGLAAMAEALPGLQVDTARMRKNLEMLPAAALPEAVPMLIERALAAHAEMEEKW